MRAVFYMHGGSANHGCEAIVRSSYEINKPIFEQFELFSQHEEEDYNYLDIVDVEIKSSWLNMKKNSLDYIKMAFQMKVLGKSNAYIKYRYKKLLKALTTSTVAFSIGGDNYCYDGMPEVLAELNKRAVDKGSKTVLWGASIEPQLLQDEKVREDLRRYSLIVVRETISYDALLQAGIVENVRLYPDPAFTLQKNDVVLPGKLGEKEFVGLNLSPLVMDCGVDENIAYRNFENLIQYIIEKTELDIALIPHVVWEENDDRVPLAKLYERFEQTGRVYMINDMDATKLKGIISKCKYFIGARTHATIAAYSTHVPTLVMGYSVKARGIARDIFGTEEGYVLPVQNITSEYELIEGFCWLMEHEQEIREKLKIVMPIYIEKAHSVKQEIENLIRIEAE